LFVALSIFTLLTLLFGVTAFMQGTRKSAAASTPPGAETVSFKAGRIATDGATLPSAEEARDANTVAQDISAPDPSLITASTYTFASMSGVALEDMSTGTTQLVGANLDDTASVATNIGFDFWYDGTRATQFSVNANGLLRLGATAVSTGFTNGLASTTDAPKIGAFWDDLCTGTSGKVHYKVTGSAPNRKLVVEWKNMQITRNAGCGGVGTGTFQVWLSETTGLIEFVYGSGLTTSNDGGYSVGLQSGAATNFASVTTSGPTVSYAVANDTQTTAITSGTAYLFTPNVPNAPTGFSATSVTATSMTINWTDNATNEVGYAIYQSNDGVNYSFVTQAAANAVSQAINGLNPSTTYFFNIYAVTEGALSSALNGSQMTSAPGVVMSTAAGGNWSSTATWVGGVLPTANDNVTIVDGATVTIDTAAVALNVTVGTGGTPAILQWDSTLARSLTTTQGVSIASNGTFQSATTGTVTTHVLSVGTNLTNNGVLDFSTNGNTAGAGITFTGAANNTFDGTGATTDIRTLTINKGTSSANTLELLTSSFTVQGTTVDGTPMAFLTLTNGTLKVSGTFTLTGRVFTTAAYTIGATAGFWLNNPNFTVAGQNGSPTESGLLRISQGTFNIGTLTGNSMGFSSGSTITVEGGTVNAAGRFGVATSTNTITYNQSGGTITVCTVGNASTTLASFDLGTSLTSAINISGGTIITQLANTGGSGPRDYRMQAGGGVASLTGGTLQLGNASSGAAKTFIMRGVLPLNMVVSNTSAGHTGQMDTTLVNYNNLAQNITINSTATFNTGNVIFLITGNMTNNGTLTSTGASSRYYHLGNGVAQTESGTGVVTAPMTSFDVDNALGVTLSTTNQIVTARIILFTGNIMGANKFTLGNGGATTGTIQIGNTTTPLASGTFDAAPTFNLGTGGQVISYLRTSASRTTGPEVNPTRTLTTMTYDDNDTTHTLTIAGGDLTVNTTAALTNGRVVTGANNLIIGSAGTVTRTTGYVDGNLRKTYTATGSKTFEVGTANGYSPVTVNVTAGTFPATFTAKATQGPQPNLPGPNALQRYWTLAGTGLTADLTFQYLAADVVGNEASYHVFKYDGMFTDVGGTISTGAHTAMVTGVSSFSDWTAAEPGSEVLRSMTVNDVTSVETDSGMHNVTFTVNLSSASALTAMASWSTAPGTATANVDYVTSAGVVTITPGNTMQTFTVPIKGDVLDEANETFSVNLSAPSGATIADSQGVCTIIDDDINSGDFDGDGKNDLSIFRANADMTGTAKWYVLNSADNSVTEQQFGAPTDIPVAGDFDGDGKKDIAVFRPNDDGMGASAFYISKGSAQNFDKYAWGAQGDVPVVGDYDGDLKSDVAVFRPSDGKWYVRKSSDGQLLVQQWGLATDRMVPADYDADGKTDFAVFRNDDPVAGSGTWYILRSSDSGVVTQQWGVNSDKLVPADYDVDGKADIAVWRPTDGTWYILKSSNGGLQAAQWGQMGDVPVAGDYDGDSVADLAVWRPSSGIYFILQSSDGYIGPVWGLPADVPIASKYVPVQ
jgi:hypothetical protein